MKEIESEIIPYVKKKKEDLNSRQIKKDGAVTLTTNNHLEPRSNTEEEIKKRGKTVNADNQSGDK